jgi:hypothetical protein
MEEHLEKMKWIPLIRHTQHDWGNLLTSMVEFILALILVPVKAETLAAKRDSAFRSLSTAMSVAQRLSDMSKFQLSIRLHRRHRRRTWFEEQ